MIELWMEPRVHELWERRLAHLRATVRPDLKEWEALALILRDFWLKWGHVK